MLGTKNPLKNLPQISDFLIKVALYIKQHFFFLYVCFWQFDRAIFNYVSKVFEIVFVLLNFHYDWLRKLARSFRPIKCKLKTIATLSFAFFFPRFEFSLADNDVNLCFDCSLWLLPINLALFFSTQSKSALSVRSWLVNAFKALKVYYVTEEKKTAGKIDMR